MSTLQLLQMYSATLEELYKRRVLRTSNNPAADYAEVLVCKALSLKRTGPSEKGYDGVGVDGLKYQVKARRITAHSKPTRFGAFRQLEKKYFDFLVAVLFGEDFSVEKAKIIPHSEVVHLSFWQPRINGHILPISDSLWNSPGSTDIKTELKQAAQQL